MPNDSPADDLEREFEALAKRAQLQIPADRRAGLLNGYRELRNMVEVLRQNLPPSAEPASTFDPDRMSRTPDA